MNDGLLSRKPVVALESTVITHGLPYPDNLKYAYIYLFCVIQFVNSKLILLYKMFFNDFSQGIKFRKWNSNYYHCHFENNVKFLRLLIPLYVF